MTNNQGNGALSYYKSDTVAAPSSMIYIHTVKGYCAGQIIENQNQPLRMWRTIDKDVGKTLEVLQQHSLSMEADNNRWIEME